MPEFSAGVHRQPPLGDDLKLLLECVKEPLSLAFFSDLEARRLGLPKYHPSRHALYMRLYRLVKDLESKGLLRIEKRGGLLWISAAIDL